MPFKGLYMAFQRFSRSLKVLLHLLESISRGNSQAPGEEQEDRAGETGRGERARGKAWRQLRGPSGQDSHPCSSGPPLPPCAGTWMGICVKGL